MRRGPQLSARIAALVLLTIICLAGTVLAGAGRAAGTQMLDTKLVIFRQGEDGYTGCADTRISVERPDSNFASQELVIGAKGGQGSLIRFDVSSLPANALIQQAVLGIFVSNYGERTSPVQAGVYMVRREWKETEATWLHATAAQLWGLPGCSEVPDDREGTALDEAMLYERDTWVTWDVAAAVQEWIADPEANHGLLLRQTSLLIGGEYDIRQSEYPGIEVRPYLSVTYTEATPTPTGPPTATSTPTPPPIPCVGTPEPGAVLLVLQNNGEYAGAEDTYLDFDHRDTSYADEWFMRVGYRQHWSGLLRFDLTPVPTGSRIICAALSLYAERWSGQPSTVGAYVVHRANEIGEATWNSATSSEAWQEGGCNGGADRRQLPESLVTIHTINRWFDFDLTRTVDGWVNGGLPNHGLSLQALDEWDNDTVWFTASGDSSVYNRPRMIVLYVGPPDVTETATPTATATHTPTPTATATHTPTPTQTLLLSTATASPTATTIVQVVHQVWLPLMWKAASS